MPSPIPIPILNAALADDSSVLRVPAPSTGEISCGLAAPPALGPSPIGRSDDPGKGIAPDDDEGVDVCCIDMPPAPADDPGRDDVALPMRPLLMLPDDGVGETPPAPPPDALGVRPWMAKPFAATCWRKLSWVSLGSELNARACSADMAESK